MISAKTIFSFLLAVGLALGLWLFAQEHRDDCDRQPKVNGQTQYIDVQSGSHTVTLPCKLWVARQPQKVQGLWFLNVAIGLVFGISAFGDWKRFREERRQWRV